MHIAPVTAANNGVALVTLTPPIAVAEDLVPALFGREAGGGGGGGGAGCPPPPPPPPPPPRNALLAQALVPQGFMDDGEVPRVREERGVTFGLRTLWLRACFSLTGVVCAWNVACPVTLRVHGGR